MIRYNDRGSIRSCGLEIHISSDGTFIIDSTEPTISLCVEEDGVYATIEVTKSEAIAIAIEILRQCMDKKV
jgi:hypothetical protein